MLSRELTENWEIIPATIRVNVREQANYHLGQKNFEGAEKIVQWIECILALALLKVETHIASEY